MAYDSCHLSFNIWETKLVIKNLTTNITTNLKVLMDKSKEKYIAIFPLRDILHVIQA